MMRTAWLAGAFLVLATAASAQSPRGMTFEEIRAALVEAGFETTLADNSLVGEISGMNYAVYGYNCDEATTRCTEFVFSAGFDLAEPFALEKANEWNFNQYAGRVALNAEGDPFIDHVFSVSAPGDAAVVRECALLWESLMIRFSDYIELPIVES